jgi:hypothetical protein
MAEAGHEHRLGIKIDVSNVAEALEILEGTQAR